MNIHDFTSIARDVRDLSQELDDLGELRTLAMDVWGLER